MTKYSGILEDFLSTDINENLEFCDEVLTAITQASTKEDSFCGNVYELEITADKAIFHNLHDDSCASETIDLTQLQTILIAWREKITAIKK
ncbi:MAG: hypothetical protein GQ569_13670 [Methylococcaceae bacterium]|nr:hypothetical protein [Methylococcaceae bacterium]